jgi:iron complex outermembrane receptor protein
VEVRKSIWAAYIETAFYVGDAWKFTAGGRYSSEILRSRLNRGVFGNPEVDNPLTPAKWTNFSPRVTARYTINSDNNVYASFSKGFKSGVIGPYDTVTPPARPETLKAYEIGYKGAPTSWLQLDVAGFYYDYRDLQVSRFNPPSYIFQNAANAKIKGIDVNVAVRVTHDFSFNGSLEALDAKYGSFPQAGVYTANADGSLSSTNVDLSGQQLYRAPKFTGTIGADYKVDTSIGALGANFSVYLTSRQLWDLQGYVIEPSFATVGGEVSYSPSAVPNLRLVLWGKNLTDKAHLQSLLETGVAAGVSYAPPRQYGVRAEYNY